MSNQTKHVKTKHELAKCLPKIDRETGEIVDGISTTALSSNWMQKDGNPGKCSHGYNVNAWREFVLSHLEENETSASGGALDDLKKREQVRNIRAQRARTEEALKQAIIETARLRGEMVPIEEMYSTLAEHAAAVRAAFRYWLQRIAAERRDPELLEWADNLHDDCMRFLQAEISKTETPE